MTVKAVRYGQEFAPVWNRFVTESKNGLFLFDRRYLEYHQDRFEDFSIVLLDVRGRPLALFPASRHDDTVVSHGGLTFGGIVTGTDMRAAEMLILFDVLVGELKRHGIRKLVYKAVPLYLHKMPAQEDLYALYRHGARLCRRDASSVLFRTLSPTFSENKRRCIRKAERSGITVARSTDFASFFAIGERVLSSRHNVKPVHTAEEMELLARSFPDNIRMHASFSSDTMLAGVIAYIYPTCVHFQYSFCDDSGLDVGALDMVIGTLVASEYAGTHSISFGVSTEDAGRILNRGLIHQKEMFGARTVVHDYYELELS